MAHKMALVGKKTIHLRLNATFLQYTLNGRVLYLKFHRKTLFPGRCFATITITEVPNSKLHRVCPYRSAEQSIPG